MRTWGEIAGLVGGALRLWRRFLPQLVFWFALGYAVNLAGRYASTLLGAEHLVLATLCQGVSLIATACATLLMMNALGPGLPTYQRLVTRTAKLLAGEPGTPAPELPPRVAEPAGRLDTLAAVVGPVLAIYSVWNLVAEQARELFIVNIAVHGLFGTASYSINFGRVGFYAAAAAVVWVLRTGVGRTSRWARSRARRAGGRSLRRTGTVLTGVYILLEGLWVYLLFIAVYAITSDVRSWWSRRAVEGWLYQRWEDLTDALPTILIPLPEMVRALGTWFFGSLLPATFDVVGLPLMFLAVTATVFGWRGRRLAVEVDEQLRRLNPRLAALPVPHRLVRSGPTRVVAEVLTEDLRTKYVPLLTSLSMLVRRGVRFVGAFLVLASVLALLEAVLTTLALRPLGPSAGLTAVANEALVALVVGVVVQPVLVSLYAAAFDRALEAGDPPDPGDPADPASVAPLSPAKA